MACGPVALMRSSFLSGCADYLRDPWLPEELGIRALGILQRMLRRFRFPWGEISLQGAYLATPSGEVTLTLHESRILRALLMGRGSPVSRQALSYFLWGNPGPAGSRAIDVHVAVIRRKIAAVAPEAGRFIRAVRREGYLIPEAQPRGGK
jgi:DNA-binding response OmpR family regulator